jgi:predicted nuclease with TOPRIM domain
MLCFQEELVESIQKKMDKLKEEKKELTKELEETESLGKEVQSVTKGTGCNKRHRSLLIGIKYLNDGITCLH